MPVPDSSTVPVPVAIAPVTELPVAVPPSVRFWFVSPTEATIRFAVVGFRVALVRAVVAEAETAAVATGDVEREWPRDDAPRVKAVLAGFTSTVLVPARVKPRLTETPLAPVYWNVPPLREIRPLRPSRRPRGCC